MKKKSRMYLRRKADKLWSELIRLKKYCEVCDKLGNQPHHIIGRKNLTLRHDLKNGVLLCFRHHNGGNQSAHNDPLWFGEWLQQNRKKDYNYLMYKRMELATKIDYEEIIDDLKSLLECEKLGLSKDT